MTKQAKKITASYLDSLWSYYLKWNKSETAGRYQGVIDLLECLGLDWKRNDEGKHYIF